MLAFIAFIILSNLLIKQYTFFARWASTFMTHSDFSSRCFWAGRHFRPSLKFYHRLYLRNGWSRHMPWALSYGRVPPSYRYTKSLSGGNIQLVINQLLCSLLCLPNTIYSMLSANCYKWYHILRALVMLSIYCNLQ